MSDDIAQRVIRVIAQTQHLPPETLRPESTFQELGIDSLDGLQIVFALEEEFDISIPDEAARQFGTIRQVIDGLRQELEKTPAASPAQA